MPTIPYQSSYFLRPWPFCQRRTILRRRLKPQQPPTRRKRKSSNNIAADLVHQAIRYDDFNTSLDGDQCLRSNPNRFNIPLFAVLHIYAAGTEDNCRPPPFHWWDGTTHWPGVWGIHLAVNARVWWGLLSNGSEVFCLMWDKWSWVDNNKSDPLDVLDFHGP